MSFDYKEYSLEMLENWVHDVVNGDSSPHEIYSTIRAAVLENLEYHKEKYQRCLSLYELLSGQCPIKEDLKCNSVEKKFPFVCNNDDLSDECIREWNEFWKNDENKDKLV